MKQILKLSYTETQTLDEKGCVYALRDKATYLVERFEDKYIVTVFSTDIQVIKNYQMGLV